MTSLFFILRITVATMLTYIIATAILVENFLRYIFGNTEGFFVIVGALLASAVITNAFSHVRRVRLIAGAVNAGTLSSRQRRQIEIPFEAGETFDMIDAAIRDCRVAKWSKARATACKCRLECAVPRRTRTRACPACACSVSSSRGRTRSSPPSRRMARRAA